MNTSQPGSVDRASARSSVYSVIPHSIKSRIPRILSVRRPSPPVEAPSRGQTSDSPMTKTGDMPRGNGHSRISSYSLGTTCYSSRPSSSNSATSTVSRATTPPPTYLATVAAVVPGSPAVFPPRNQARDVVCGESTSFSDIPADTASGVSWVWAAQGLALLRICFQHAGPDSSSEKRHKAPFDASLSRNLYVHSLTYLLRALPPDLSLDEHTSLAASLPPSLGQGASTPSMQAAVANTQPLMDTSQSSQASVVHRMTATLTLNLILFSSLLLPYFRAFIQVALEYEQRYHVRQRAYNLSIAVLALVLRKLRSTGQSGLNGYRKIHSSEEGQRLAAALDGMASSWLIGVSGGFCQGLGEGIARVNTKSSEEASVSVDESRSSTRTGGRWEW